MHAILDCVIPEIVGRAVNESGFHAGARHPYGVAVRIVIAPIGSLRPGSSSKLAAPNHQRIFQKSTRFQVFQQARNRLIDFGGILGVQFEQLRMLIPLIAVRTLHEAHAALGKPPGKKTLPAEIARGFGVESIQLSGGIGFFRNIESFGRGDLHAKRKLQRADPGFEIGIVSVEFGMTPVHLLQHVELIALIVRREPLRDQVRHRLFLDLFDLHARVADGCALILARQEAGTPVVLAAMPERRLDGDEPGQVLVLRSQSIERPGSHAGTPK